MNTQELETTVGELVRPGKGILAADESTGTIAKRFKSVDVENTEENRRGYREMLFATSGMAEHISGVILFEETLGQKASDGTPLAQVLARQGVVPGIKVDMGTIPIPGSPKELATQGLDGLGERLKGYREKGARFAKWRGVISIGEGLPSECCIDVNAHALARYAAICQVESVVPIVEPEVLMDGDNDIERCFEVTSDVLQRVFGELYRQGVALELMLLKPNMVIAGKKSPKQAGVEEVAEATIRCFRRVVPAAVPGVVFLSGGQSDVDATAHLDAMNKMGPHPWELSFSYGRALQAPSLEAFGGKRRDPKAAQQAFLHRARMNGAARSGSWSREMEKELVTA